jgi:hypothetical protein
MYVCMNVRMYVCVCVCGQDIPKHLTLGTKISQLSR